MKFGMVGLGAWAATWPSASGEPGTKSSAIARTAPDADVHTLPRSRRRAGATPGRVDDGACRRSDRGSDRRARRACSRGRRRRRRRQLQLPRLDPTGAGCSARRRHRFRRCRRERGSVGTRERLLLDGRRRRGDMSQRSSTGLRSACSARMVSPTSDRPVPVTSRRWCTTASSTGSCSPSPRGTRC